MDHESWDEFLEAYQAIKRESEFLYQIVIEAFEFMDDEAAKEIQKRIEQHGKNFSDSFSGD